MTDQARTSRVLIALIVSMTIGAVVLMALDNGALTGPAFSLSRLYSLPGEDVVMKEISEAVEIYNWSRIEVFYSNTCGGDVAELTVLQKLAGKEDLDAHFVICNGTGGDEGAIEPTARWNLQKQSLSAQAGTIRICVVGNGVNNGVRIAPNDNQVRRVDDLISFLCRQFSIEDTDASISRPAGLASLEL